MTIAEAITRAADRLAAHRIETSRLDAELLLAHVLGRDRTWLVTHYHDELDIGTGIAYDRLLDRRAVREPLQYITGTQEFWGLPFRVTSDVLIPRPETEFVVEASLTAAAALPAPTVVDLCTGSGCIAVCVASELPGARIFAVDRSPNALAVARENARRHGVASRVRFFEGDLYRPLLELDLRGTVDAITANPPYIRAGDLPSLQPEVRDFEPEIALVAGPEGTEVAERIIGEAPVFLRPGGSLVMEMGIGQAETLRRRAARTAAYGTIDVLKDLAGIERVIVAVKK